MKVITKIIALFKHLFDVIVMRFFKRIAKFVELSRWFNRKSQHYILGNWTCYIKMYINGIRSKDFNRMIKYYKYYPIAYIKFMWYSRQDIKNV